MYFRKFSKNATKYDVEQYITEYHRTFFIFLTNKIQNINCGCYWYCILLYFTKSLANFHSDSRKNDDSKKKQQIHKRHNSLGPWGEGAIS